MKLLIADDHFAVREGLKTILLADPEQRFVVCGETSSLAETRQFLTRQSVDAVLLDIQFADGSGLDLVRELQKDESRVPVLILSMYQEGSFVLNALQAGARGFVSKESAGSVLLEALLTLNQGHVYLDRVCLDALANILQKLPDNVSEWGGALGSLSFREREIFHLLVKGETPKTCAFQLGLSVKTVDNHRAAIFTKLKLASPVDLMLFARKHNLF